MDPNCLHRDLFDLCKGGVLCRVEGRKRSVTVQPYLKKKKRWIAGKGGVSRGRQAENAWLSVQPHPYTLYVKYFTRASCPKKVSSTGVVYQGIKNITGNSTDGHF